MFREDAEKFKELMTGTAEVYGKPISDTQLRIYWIALCKFDIQSVTRAFNAHVADEDRGRFFPVPADLISRLSGSRVDDGRPGVEEAWSTCIQSFDEQQTVVMTDEMMTARAAAEPLWEMRDKIAARMAFKEVYEREIAQARGMARQVNWRVSMGDNKELRQLAVNQAVREGKINQGYAAKLPCLPEVSVVALLENKAQQASAEQDEVERIRALEHIAQIKETLSKSKEIKAQDDLQKTQEAKAQTKQKIQEYKG